MRPVARLVLLSTCLFLAAIPPALAQQRGSISGKVLDQNGAGEAARSASATRVTVLSAGAVEEGVVRLARQYRQDAGREVLANFGTAPEIEKRLSAGEAVDVLIAPAAVVERALKAGALATRYPNAAQVIEHVIAGTGNEIGFGPITEIKSFEPKGSSCEVSL